MKFGVGQSVRRTEDPRLVTGAGAFTDDVNLEGQLYVAFYRSPHAHARLRAIHLDEARALADVVVVYTAPDLASLGALPCRAQLTDARGDPCFIPHRPALAEDKVYFVGQAIAAVVAESRQAARDAVELIDVDFEPLQPVVSLDSAVSDVAPLVHEERGHNVCIHFERGDAEATTKAMRGAAHIVQISVVNNRVVPTPLEPRVSVASYNDGKFTLYNPSQGAVAQQGVLARSIFRVDPADVRVISGDTGGGFGVRGEVHPETVVCLYAARELQRPVKWCGDRSEMFLADSHGRDNVSKATVALDTKGVMLGLKIETLANLGAFCSAVGPFVPTMGGGRVVGTVYRSPHIYHSVRCVFTNTMPVAAYRGAGRPEAAYLMERLMEKAAEATGIESPELRRRNFIREGDLPYTNLAGIPIRSGAFAETMDLALARADWETFDERREASNVSRKLRGIGFGCYVESSGGGPEEEARVSVSGDGSVEITVGTYSHGQGHETAFAQIAHERLGVNFDRIRLIQGDTREVVFGGGTGGSRSSQMGGIAVLRASDGVIERGKRIAAELLQGGKETVSFEGGLYRVDDRTVTLQEVAQAAVRPEFGGDLSDTHRYHRGEGYTFPNGCHVAEIEIDPDTGVIEVVRYTAVDDCGRVINPLLAEGQVHGGVAQGIGQAMFERVVYDDGGQLITGTFMDYAMPRAAHLPWIDVSFNEVLEPSNELGVKGIGEGGACGAPPAIVHAVLNALARIGVADIDMPITSEAIWRALNRRP